MAVCLARNASARPPAKLTFELLLPLSPPVLSSPTLIPESLGAREGLPLPVLFTGGAGGFGLAATPFILVFVAGPGRGGAAGTALAIGGGVSSWRYADGAHPRSPGLDWRLASHQPRGS